MSIENNRKTLANCKNSEFLAAAMKARVVVCEYYEKVQIRDIIEKFREKYDEEIPNEEKAVGVLGMMTDIISEIFMQFPAETVRLAAIAGFMTEEEAESISPTDIYAILLECALSVRVLDFFISVESTAGRNTGGIFRALTFLRLISGVMTTSDSESQNSTTDTKENVLAGDISESA